MEHGVLCAGLVCVFNAERSAQAADETTGVAKMTGFVCRFRLHIFSFRLAVPKICDTEPQLQVRAEPDVSAAHGSRMAEPHRAEAEAKTSCFENCRCSQSNTRSSTKEQLGTSETVVDDAFFFFFFFFCRCFVVVVVVDYTLQMKLLSVTLVIRCSHQFTNKILG